MVAMLGASIIALTLSLITIGHFSRRAKVAPHTHFRADAAFLFRDGALIDGTASARRLLDVSEPHGSDLARVMRALAPQYPALPVAVAQLAEASETEIGSQDGYGRVGLALSQGRLRLTIEDQDVVTECDPAARHVIDTLRDAVEMHRGVADGVGFPMWRQTIDGRILWTNAEYRALETALTGREAPDPSRATGALFAEQLDTGSDQRRLQRGKLVLPDAPEPRWFEFKMSALGDDLLIAAVPIDRVVQAERSLSGFVQTLTQTFAHLNVGLAIFNRARELVIFNPALTELLELSPEFLVTRPTLTQVFDRMREQRMVPEPKDYKAWRNKISTLEAAAAEEVLTETWSLVDARTFRVTGRPHPEGAVAFLFEDISSEITLERGFRSELQMGHAVIDGLDEAIAVFTPAGAMALSNRAFRMLWYGTEDPEEAPLKNFVEATRLWQHTSQPTPVWGDARDFAATIGERSNWTAEVVLQDGRQVQCRFEALSGGYTLAGFTEAEEGAVPSARARMSA
jgi:PAS domain-containing protein